MRDDPDWDEYQDALGQVMADRDGDQWALAISDAEKRILKAVFDHESEFGRAWGQLSEFARYDLRQALVCYRQVVPVPVEDDGRFRPAPSNWTGD